MREGHSLPGEYMRDKSGHGKKMSARGTHILASVEGGTSHHTERDHLIRRFKRRYDTDKRGKLTKNWVVILFQQEVVENFIS